MRDDGEDSPDIPSLKRLKEIFPAARDRGDRRLRPRNNGDFLSDLNSRTFVVLRQNVGGRHRVNFCLCGDQIEKEAEFVSIHEG